MTEFLDGLFGIRGRVVLITGGGKGIGYHMAEALVRAGARVYLCSRDGQACEAAAQALSAEGECIGFGADIATAEGIGTSLGSGALARSSWRPKSRSDRPATTASTVDCSGGPWATCAVAGGTTSSKR